MFKRQYSEGYSNCDDFKVTDEEVAQYVKEHTHRIEEPLKNGYCKDCKNFIQRKCTAKEAYGKPVPCFAIEQCSEYINKCD